MLSAGITPPGACSESSVLGCIVPRSCAAVNGRLSSIYLIGLPLLSEIRVLDVYGAALSYLPALLMFIGFTALYVVIPNSPVPLLHGLSGGALTMIVFQLAFQGFTMASQYFIYDAIFGAFAAGVFTLAIFGVGDRAQRSCICALVVSAR